MKARVKQDKDPSPGGNHRRVSTAEWSLLALIVAVGAWLRLSHLDLLEFGSDQAIAAVLALQFIRGGTLTQTGLMSSVGVTNPPLFIYLVIPLFAISQNVVAVSCLIATLHLGAIIVCWHVGRTYYGKVAGLTAAAMFAVSPWAVVYSRAIWAQDFVPILTTFLIWALHALVLGNRPKAIFWIPVLSLAVPQIHFSGIALIAAVLTILLIVRPRIDWRFAVAGIVASIIPLVPYLHLQTKQNWEDFRRAAKTMGGQDWQIPEGMTVQPNSGFLLPRRDYWIPALAVMNAGEIQDRMGISADSRFDLNRVYADHHPGQPPYFSQTLTLGDSLLALQRLLFVAAWIYLMVRAVQGVRFTKRFPFAQVTEQLDRRRAWLLVLWTTVPLAAYWLVNLWTYQSYYMILYPAHFLALGFLAELAVSKAKHAMARAAVYGLLGLILVWNVTYMLDMYRFLSRLGGAHGTFCTMLGPKREAARFLAARTDVHKLMTEGRLLQFIDNQFRQARPAEMELPFLAMQERVPAAPDPLPTNVVVIVVDENRSDFTPQQWQQLAAQSRTNFGPLHLVFVNR